MSELPAPHPGGHATAGPSADPHEQLLAQLCEHMLVDAIPGHWHEEVDYWLAGIDGLGREGDWMSRVGLSRKVRR
ncbi:MAG: hypothetical protein ACXVHB_29540 [Solirubrobacteraceae bacterium]